MKAALVAALLLLSAALVCSALIFRQTIREQSAGSQADLAARLELQKQEAERHQLWLQHRATIIPALKKMISAEGQCRNQSGGLIVARLLPLFDAMDLSSCPEAFRLAFYDYVTALKAQQHHKGEMIVEGLGVLVTGGAMAAGLAASAVGSADSAMKDDPQMALRAIGRCIVEYNITAQDIR